MALVLFQPTARRKEMELTDRLTGWLLVQRCVISVLTFCTHISTTPKLPRTLTLPMTHSEYTDWYFNGFFTVSLPISWILTPTWGMDSVLHDHLHCDSFLTFFNAYFWVCFVCLFPMIRPVQVSDGGGRLFIHSLWQLTFVMTANFPLNCLKAWNSKSNASFCFIHFTMK